MVLLRIITQQEETLSWMKNDCRISKTNLKTSSQALILPEAFSIHLYTLTLFNWSRNIIDFLQSSEH